MAFQDLTHSSAAATGGGKRPVDGEQQQQPAVVNLNNNGGGGDESGKTPRLPRWTRQEILILIQGKRVAENRVRRGRTGGLAYGSGSGQPEPKWATVSSYCRRHGVNRGPVQCRKRWSNLAGDFKKIKEWEAENSSSESFWVMRNDLRRERKLPGFFDKEVYDILDGKTAVPAVAGGIDLVVAVKDEVVEEEEKEELGDGKVGKKKKNGRGGGGGKEAVFDSGRSAAAEDGLFSDFETEAVVEKENEREEGLAEETRSGIPAPTPISEKQYHQPFSRGGATGEGTTNKTHPAPMNPEMGSTSNQNGKKRKRFEDVGGGGDGNGQEAAAAAAAAAATNPQDQLLRVLERNGRVLEAHLEAQNTSLNLDREERKDHANSLVAVLNKLADALGKIADKL